MDRSRSTSFREEAGHLQDASGCCMCVRMRPRVANKCACIAGSVAGSIKAMVGQVCKPADRRAAASRAGVRFSTRTVTRCILQSMAASLQEHLESSSTDLARAWEKDSGMRRRAHRLEFAAWLIFRVELQYAL